MQVNYSWFIIGWTVRRTTVGRQDKGLFNITQNRTWILGVCLIDLHKILVFTHIELEKSYLFKFLNFHFQKQSLIIRVSDMLASAFKLRSVSQTSL